MATIKSFEDLEVWKRARKLSQRIYELTLQGSFAKDFALRNQINESSGSVMDNIAEGFERGGNKEFIVFLGYSKGSAGECSSQLYRASDRNHITAELFQELNNESVEIGKMLGGLIQHLKTSPFRGSKFHKSATSYDSDAPIL